MGCCSAFFLEFVVRQRPSDAVGSCRHFSCIASRSCGRDPYLTGSPSDRYFGSRMQILPLVKARGLALRSVPFRLSRSPSFENSNAFSQKESLNSFQRFGFLMVGVTPIWAAT